MTLSNRMWYDLTPAQRAQMLTDIAYTLSTGDDMLIHISNAASDACEAHGIDSETLSSVLLAVARAAIDG